MRPRNAFKKNVFEASKLVSTKTLLLKHDYRCQGSYEKYSEIIPFSWTLYFTSAPDPFFKASKAPFLTLRVATPSGTPSSTAWWVWKNPANSRQISHKISLQKFKKTHRRASAGAQGEEYAIVALPHMKAVLHPTQKPSTFKRGVCPHAVQYLSTLPGQQLYSHFNTTSRSSLSLNFRDRHGTVIPVACNIVGSSLPDSLPDCHWSMQAASHASIWSVSLLRRNFAIWASWLERQRVHWICSSFLGFLAPWGSTLCNVSWRHSCNRVVRLQIKANATMKRAFGEWLLGCRSSRAGAVRLLKFTTERQAQPQGQFSAPCLGNSETGRMRFRRGWFQMDNTVSESTVSNTAQWPFWFSLSAGKRDQWVPCSLILLLCVPKRTHQVFRRTHGVWHRTEWVLSSETVLSKQ